MVTILQGQLADQVTKAADDPTHCEFASDLEKIYRILRKFHSRVPKLELVLHQSGLVLHSDLTEQVLSRCSLYIVGYNNLLGEYAQAEKMVDAYELLKELRRKGCESNAGSYTTMIQVLCGQEKMEEAMRVFVEMEKSGCEVDVVTYTTLISGFCKWGKIVRSYEILESIIRKGFTPSQMTYLQIMLAHEKKEDFEECIIDGADEEDWLHA
ncbi:putative pentatricopeptide repeat-containing protein At5g65820 [Rosa chinensis]|uniref:putative pentatricopeptide repeat-containing protein At5g65820 n=1 Tax=Rosa chinensis TaxID=74649 RepID=UPI000D094D2C|nr:putative pentatricopeptide repeat-containing protein At5g65820 [Rosa chinensis]